MTKKLKPEKSAPTETSSRKSADANARERRRHGDDIDAAVRVHRQTHDAHSAEARHELNLVAFPLGNLSGREKGTKATFRVTILVNGEPQVQEWTVSTTAKALPSPFERNVLSALARIATEQGLDGERIEFSRYQIASYLPGEKRAKKGGGDMYKRIDDALRNLTQVNISTNKFWDAEAGVYRERHFHIVEDLELVHHKSESKRSIEAETKALNLFSGGRTSTKPPLSSIQWSRVVFDSILAGHFVFYDHNLARRLQRPTSVRLYEFLNSEWRGRSELVYDLFELAHERIGISRSFTTISELNRSLAPAYFELENEMYLRPKSTEIRGRRITFVRGDSDPALEGDRQSPAPDGERETWVRGLVERGVLERVARDIVESATPGILKRMPEFFAMFDEDKRAGRITVNAAGYLVRMVKQGWTRSQAKHSATHQESLFEDAQKTQTAGGAGGSRASRSPSRARRRRLTDPDRAMSVWAAIAQDFAVGRSEVVRKGARRPFVAEWLIPCQPTGMDGDTVVVLVPNATFAQFLASSPARPELDDLAGRRGVKLRFVLDGDDPTQPT